MRKLLIIILFQISNWGYSQITIDTIYFEPVICVNNLETIIVQISPAGNYSYQWQGNCLFSNSLNDTTNFTFINPGNEYLKITITDGLGNTVADSVLIEIRSFNGFNANASSNSINCGNSAQLNTSSEINNTLFNMIGWGTGANSVITFPSPFANFYANTKQQYLFLASELNSFGILPGNIHSLNFPVNSTQGLLNYPAYTIKMDHTTSNSLTTTFLNVNPIPYYGPTNTSIQQGNNILNLSSPFVWDGINNIIIEICYNWTAINVYTANSISPWTTTSFNSSNVFLSDNIVACSQNSAVSVSNNRPLIAFGSQQTNFPDTIYYQWTPSPFLNDSSLQNPLATPIADTWFYVYATDSVCSVIDSVHINIDSTINLTSNAPNGTNVCVDDSYNFSAGLGGSNSIIWIFSGGDIDTSYTNIQNVYYDNLGTFPYVLIGNNQCGGTDTLNGIINVVDSNFVFLINQPIDTFCTYEFITYTVTNQSGVWNYVWTLDVNGFPVIQNGTLFNYSFGQAGIYTLTLEATKCNVVSDTSFQVYLLNCVSVEEYEKNEFVKLLYFDNKVELFAELNNSIENVIIYSISGQEIQNYELSNEYFTTEISTLSQGIYLISVKTINGEKTFKIVR